MVKVQEGLVPEHTPVQLVNTEPPVGVAVSVTGVPFKNVPEHVPGQLMPPTEDTMVPVPVPLDETLKIKLAVLVRNG